jgi:hypothetical protein
MRLFQKGTVLMVRIALFTLLAGLTLPVSAHMSCRDVLSMERDYGRFHTKTVVLVSLSSYVVGYVSSLAILGDTLTQTAQADRISSREVNWVTNGINQTRIPTFKKLFFQTGTGAQLYNEDKYKLAADLVIEQCRANPQDTVINLFEEKVIVNLLERQAW